jgi:hypothetical protein
MIGQVCKVYKPLMDLEWLLESSKLQMNNKVRQPVCDPRSHAAKKSLTDFQDYSIFHNAHYNHSIQWQILEMSVKNQRDFY